MTSMICNTCGRGGEPTLGTDTPFDGCDCAEPDNYDWYNANGMWDDHEAARAAAGQGPAEMLPAGGDAEPW